MKNPISIANRRDAIIAIVQKKCRAAGANKRQMHVSVVKAVSMFNRGESASRAIRNGISTCEIFIENNLGYPMFSNCNVVKFPRKCRQRIKGAQATPPEVA